MLYPSYDPQNGALSIAVYDRDSGRSEQVYSGLAPHLGTNVHSTHMRVEWLPDGKHILVAQIIGENALSLLVVPHGVKEPVRHIGPLTNGEYAGCLPFVMTGSQVLLNGDHSLTRLDWMTGAMQTVSNNVLALPMGGNKIIGGIQGVEDCTCTSTQNVLGVIDPETLAFTPQFTFNHADTNVSLVYFHPATRQTLTLTRVENLAVDLEIRLAQDGVEQFFRHLSRAGCRINISHLNMGPKKDRLFAAYISKAAVQTNCEYGLLEIPLNNDPLQFTPLFHVTPSDDARVTGCFTLAESSLSHDGRTWAVSSAWVGFVDKHRWLRPEDSALYLVPLDRSRPRITKVPIALPAAADDWE